MLFWRHGVLDEGEGEVGGTRDVRARRRAGKAGAGSIGVGRAVSSHRPSGWNPRATSAATEHEPTSACRDKPLSSLNRDTSPRSVRAGAAPASTPAVSEQELPPPPPLQRAS
ncbi:hypothetical protein SKAU_G00242610 [Synaphobranchus kaupii]|uniref:Uncharacterized protein n=1 Tax=Synaphobranchus kaupii TaxID=118154 RepID=A0A9Q1F832_SYNKA|nr:hypothetical protein SKAU_G00242610 [Synaphobranchus kaupii]